MSSYFKDVMHSEGLAVMDEAGSNSPQRPDSGCSTAEASGEDWTEGDSMKSLEFSHDHASLVLKEQLFTIGNSALVTVSHVVGPGKFWCQLSQNASSLKKLMQDLQIHYAQNKPVPPSGPACVVRHPDSGLWHRGKIVKLQPFPYVDVQFVDYGQTFRVMLQDLCRLHSTFAKLKCQAFQCRLVDVTCPSTLPSAEWGEPAFMKFRTFVHSAASSALKCTIYGVMYDSEGTVVNLVDLTCPSSVSLNLSQSASVSITEKSSKCPAPGLEVGSQEKVLMTCVKDLHQFYGQLVRHSSEIDKLNEEIESFCRPLQSVKCSLIPGASCFAKYSDGQWYRGLVKITQPVVMVHFLDYGDIVVVKASDILPVSEEASEIMSVPIQAVEFNLAHAPADASSELNRWFENNATGKQFTATVLEKCPDGKYTVELFDGKININQAVKERARKAGRGPLKAPDHSGLPKSHDPFASRNYKTSGLRVSSKGNDGKTQQGDPSFQDGRRETISRNTNGRYDGTMSVNLPTRQKLEKPWCKPKGEVFGKTKAFDSTQRGVKKDMTVGVTTTPYAGTADPLQTRKVVLIKGIHGRPESYSTSFPKLANLPHPPITPGLVTEVYLSHVNSTDSLFVQLVEDEDKIHSLVEELNAAQPCDDPVDFIALQEGDVVSAMYPEDESWYRAVVKKVNEDESILVEFIDFGNHTTIPSNMLRRLNNFLDTPRLSVHCSLNDMGGTFSNISDEEKTVQLKSIAEGELKRLTCMFISWSDFVWRIDFVDPETKPRSSLSKLGGTSPLSTPNNLSNAAAASTTGTSCPSQPYPKHLHSLAELPSKPIRRGVLMEVYICHVNSLDSFFVQLAEDEDQICSLVKEMNAGQPCSQSDVDFTTLKEGDVVSAMYPEDESWYRAVVKKVHQDNSTLVEFIDFGNEAVVRSNLVTTLKKKLLDIPRFGIHCCVGYNVNGSLEGTSKDKLATKLRGYAKRAVKVSCIFTMQSDHVWEVIFEEPDTVLKSYPVGMGGTTNVTKDSYQHTSTVYSTVNLPTLCKQSLESLPKLRDLPTKTITPDVVTEVYLSHVNSQASFYVQLVKDEDDIHSLVEKLNTDEPCDDPGNVRTLQEGDVVSAMYPEDEAWYRAVVKKVNEDESILVEFIDFGNEATIVSSKIRCLQKSFLDIPKFSVHCHLKDGSSLLCSDELMTTFSEACDGNAKKINCVFIRESDDVWEIQLVDSGSIIEHKVLESDMTGLQANNTSVMEPGTGKIFITN
ncbi:hypothetical protein ACEWY4_005343 [Coilia grayii]|uniref:Tudor domain-containing protein n=1 Tax=Coilia grayii TaxID=363190 RepID=A0ABD1KI85_9TELE